MKKLIFILSIISIVTVKSQTATYSMQVQQSLKLDQIIYDLENINLGVDIAGTPYVNINNTPTVVTTVDYSKNISGVTANVTGTTAVDVLPAPGVGQYNYITDILITNGSTLNNTWVNIIDEISGSTLWTGFAPINGGGFSVSLRTPIKLPNPNSKVQVKCETSGTLTRVSVSGFKAP